MPFLFDHIYRAMRFLGWGTQRLRVSWPGHQVSTTGRRHRVFWIQLPKICWGLWRLVGDIPRCLWWNSSPRYWWVEYPVMLWRFLTYPLEDWPLLKWISPRTPTQAMFEDLLVKIWRNLYLGELANCLTENLGMWQKKPVNWAWEELKIAGQLNSPRKRSEKQPETHHGRHGPPEASSSHLGFTFIRVDLLRDHVHQVLGRAPLPSVDQGGFHSYGMLWLWL